MCRDRTTRRSKSGIRVRQSPQNRPSLAKTDSCWLVWQTNWSCRARRTPTSTGSNRWRFPRMGPRLSLDRTTGRSNSGIQVRLCPQIAPPWPKLTPAGLSGRRTGGAKRGAQPRDLVGCVFPGWDQDRVGIEQRDDPSLGFRCAVSPQNRPSLAKTDACWLVWQMRWGC